MRHPLFSNFAVFAEITLRIYDGPRPSTTSHLLRYLSSRQFRDNRKHTRMRACILNPGRTLSLRLMLPRFSLWSASRFWLLIFFKRFRKPALSIMAIFRNHVHRTCTTEINMCPRTRNARFLRNSILEFHVRLWCKRIHSPKSFLNKNSTLQCIVYPKTLDL